MNLSKRAALLAIRDGLCLFARKSLAAAYLVGRLAVRALPDAVGLIGLALLFRGVLLQYGEPIALMVLGGLLLAAATISALRGGD